MKKNRLITLSISFFVLSIVLILTGASYAFFSSSILGDLISSIKSDNIAFIYKEGTNTIALNEMMPMTDKEGLDQANYFEFEVKGTTPKAISLPYSITVKKTDSSSDIGDAIKLGLTRAVYNEEDVYAKRVISSKLVSYEQCQAIKKYYTTGGDIYRLFLCTKMYNAGDPIPPIYAVQFTYGEYDSLEECQPPENELFDSTTTVNCVENNGHYNQVVTTEEYSSEEKCLNSRLYREAEEHNANPTCVVRTSSSSNYEYDMYQLILIDDYATLEACENNYYYDGECLLYPPGTLMQEEEEIKIVKYSDLPQYTNKKINNLDEKKLYQSTIFEDNENYKQVYRLRVWLDYDVDFTQSKYQNAAFGLTVNTYSEGKTKTELAPGLYDNEDNLLASWDQLVNDYGLDVEKYYSYRDYNVDWNTNKYTYYNSSMLGYILENNPELMYGDHLVLGNVSQIGASALRGTNLSAVDMSEGVTIIDDSAFCDLKYLNSIVIPSTVETIGYNSFASNSNLSSVTFAKNSKLEKIYGSAFSGCTNLSAIDIPATVTIIDYSAFANTNLQTINIPENSDLRKIGSNAFSNTKLTELYIPSKVSVMDHNTFAQGNFININVDSNNSTFSSIDGVLYSKDQKTLVYYPKNRPQTTYTVPDGVTTLGNNSVSFTQLESIVLPSSLKVINNYALDYNSRLVTVNLPDGLTTIGQRAFIHDDSLETLNVPSSVTSIGEYAFIDIPHIYYTGDADGSPWGALAIN